MKLTTYSHRRASVIIPRRLLNPVKTALSGISENGAKGSAPGLRKAVLEALTLRGWSSCAKVDALHGITVTAMNDDVALCLQTGNMSRFYADLLKLQLLRQRKKAKAAFFLIPTKEAAVAMGSNIANYERFIDELKLFGEIITMPIFVIGLHAS